MKGVYIFIVETHLNRAYCDVGWGNGYALLPKEHPWYSKNYDDIPVAVHGGLTFGDKFPHRWFSEKREMQMCEEMQTLDIDDLKDMWCIGFDCAHAGDNLNSCPKSYVWKQAEFLKEQCLGEDNPELRRWVRKYKLSQIKKNISK